MAVYAMILNRSIKRISTHECTRTFTSSTTKYKTSKKKWSDELSAPVAADMIGTPDPISNLRPVKYYIPPNETQEVRLQ
ncbi:hypothetical protein BDF20DRAFT_310804 [Mycotypha africana]|uniref:uncharacterized protein n=1 Tax=Mycotypha africana TaxID=64632 RepID=UPI0023016646|nr:uncharacterized protein BDF20DRAFT_310804 [Mycotypha africana]KAI8988192.1 hypothetical protein BDF20DRAFT_310804 [Mycotypha africana]